MKQEFLSAHARGEAAVDASHLLALRWYRRSPSHPLQAAVLWLMAGQLQIGTAQETVPTGDTLPEVTISSSGLALGSSEMTTPVSVLEGDGLVLRREASLGETLEGEPGIRASHFGAGASRPIIRGMDGPRVRVLSDGAEVFDASTISPDHAVAIEPMLAQQIEVLRGPSALAYGGGCRGRRGECAGCQNTDRLACSWHGKAC